MTKEKIQEEIEFLETKRAKVFDNWSSLVKQNDREYEFFGRNNENLEKEADLLLAEQKEINHEITKLLDKLEE